MNDGKLHRPVRTSDAFLADTVDTIIIDYSRVVSAAILRCSVHCTISEPA